MRRGERQTGPSMIEVLAARAMLAVAKWNHLPRRGTTRLALSCALTWQERK